MSRTLDAEIELCDLIASGDLLATDEVLLSKSNLVARTLISSLAVVLAATSITQVITNGVTDKAPSEDAVFDALALKAPLASPTFTGTPVAPTAAPGTNTTQLATTAFVTVGIAALSTVYQPLDADLTAIGALAKTDGNFIVGDGATWVAESGSTVRTSLGLGTAAVVNTGTSGAAIPLLNTGNTWGAAQTIAAGGAPFSVNSTNSNALKMVFSDNGSVRGYLGADATYALYIGDGSANIRVRVTATTGLIEVGGVAVPTISSSDNLTNKTITAPVMSGTWTGSPTFSGAPIFSGELRVNAATPLFSMSETGASTDNKNWLFLASSEAFSIRTWNDDRNSSVAWITVERTALTIDDIKFGAGVTIGSPTGGNKGVGTLNATGVYDDNTLLTDLVLDLAVKGDWDRKRYAEHPINAELASWWLNPKAYAAVWREQGFLPGLISWKDEMHRPPVGALVTRLTAVAEVQAVHIANHEERISQLEERLAA